MGRDSTSCLTGACVQRPCASAGATRQHDSDSLVDKYGARVLDLRNGHVKRMAKRGANVGDEFWGCTGYPAGKGTLSIG